MFKREVRKYVQATVDFKENEAIVNTTIKQVNVTKLIAATDMIKKALDDKILEYLPLEAQPSLKLNIQLFLNEHIN